MTQEELDKEMDELLDCYTERNKLWAEKPELSPFPIFSEILKQVDGK